MGHSVDLSELQNVVGRYVTSSNLLVAGGPLAGAFVFRLVAGRSRMVNLGMAGAGAWFAVQELSGPMLRLMNEQFGYMQSLLR